jgi:glycosyltransferase involved in cell wall biosynthesis
MKIAICGTRGIPNNYGGFEQCAEKLAILFRDAGHTVTVYNSLAHPYKDDMWNDIKIIKPTKKVPHFSNFFGEFYYDFASINDALSRRNDIILELGYAPCSLFYFLKKRANAKLITNMAGMEWKRTKWNFFARTIIRYCEKLAVKNSDALISDNPGIQGYFLDTYSKDSFYIPYGAEIFDNPDKSILNDFNLTENNYFVLLARFQPDNNIEVILDGYHASGSDLPFLIIGSHQNNYGEYLKTKFQNNKNIKFIGGIYDYNLVSTLRWFSRLYFHGHSCGGTNPSLLEAMASNSYIVSHDNIFNRSVLGENAFYFNTSNDVARIINDYSPDHRTLFCLNNKNKVIAEFNWDLVADSYLKAFTQVLGM